MKKSTKIWTVVFALVVLALILHNNQPHGAAGRGVGKVYVQQVEMNEVHADPKIGAIGGAKLSHSRTFGLWLAAVFTICMFSFTYRDNPFYKTSESILIGVSAGYWMVYSFWTVLVPNLLSHLMPDAVSRWAMPGTVANVSLIYWIPFVLGIMLLARLSPKGSWLARWPLALIVGTTAGMKIIAYLSADFSSQISNTILPLLVMNSGEVDWATSIKYSLTVVGVIAGLVYFFFSFEHKGVVGQVSRVGIWFLMITFGAAFGYTVMGRITLLSQRIEFLVDDWLWLVDPVGKRIGM